MRPPAASLSRVVMAPPSRRDLVAASCGPRMQRRRWCVRTVATFLPSPVLSLSRFVGLMQPVAMVTRYGVTTVEMLIILLKDGKRLGTW